jgi:hypothetical protein
VLPKLAVGMSKVTFELRSMAEGMPARPG